MKISLVRLKAISNRDWAMRRLDREENMSGLGLASLKNRMRRLTVSGIHISFWIMGSGHWTMEKTGFRFDMN